MVLSGLVALEQHRAGTADATQVSVVDVQEMPVVVRYCLAAEFARLSERSAGGRTTDHAVQSTALAHGAAFRDLLAAGLRSSASAGITAGDGRRSGAARTSTPRSSGALARSE